MLSGFYRVYVAYTKLHFRYYVRLRVFYDKISVGNIILPVVYRQHGAYAAAYN